MMPSLMEVGEGGFKSSNYLAAHLIRELFKKKLIKLDSNDLN